MCEGTRGLVLRERKGHDVAGFQIEFRSEKDKLFVDVHTPDAGTHYLSVSATPGVFYAPMVAAHLKQELKTFIETKTRIAYRRGYADGKGHKKKAAEFWGDFDLNYHTGVTRDA